MMKPLTASTAHTITAQMMNFLALSAAAWASAYWPMAHRFETLFALMMATIPKGKQHKNVDKTAQTRWLLGKFCCCAPPGG